MVFNLMCLFNEKKKLGLVLYNQLIRMEHVNVCSELVWDFSLLLWPVRIGFDALGGWESPSMVNPYLTCTYSGILTTFLDIISYLLSCYHFISRLILIFIQLTHWEENTNPCLGVGATFLARKWHWYQKVFCASISCCFRKTDSLFKPLRW